MGENAPQLVRRKYERGNRSSFVEENDNKRNCSFDDRQSSSSLLPAAPLCQPGPSGLTSAPKKHWPSSLPLVAEKAGPSRLQSVPEKNGQSGLPPVPEKTGSLRLLSDRPMFEPLTLPSDSVVETTTWCLSDSTMNQTEFLRQHNDVVEDCERSTEVMVGLDSSFSLTGPQSILQNISPLPSCSNTKFVSRETQEENQETHCIICGENFEEDWIQCSICKGWAHENCADLESNSLFYKCDSCFTMDMKP